MLPSMDSMEIAIFGQPPTVDRLVDEVRQVKDDGFSTYVTPQIFGLDALTALAVAGNHVPGMRLGTGVVPTYRQHPMMMAQQALTVNQAIGGGLLLGIGLSHQVVVEGMWGLSYEKPLRHMREFLAALMPLLDGEQVRAEGETLVARGGLEIRADRPEVVLAALGPKMLQLAGREADGTLTWMVGPRTLESHIVPTISKAATGAGRPAPQVLVSLPVCLTDAPDVARKAAAEEFAIYGQLPSYRAMLDRENAAGPEDVAIIGTAAEITERIEELQSVGTTSFAANAFGTPEEKQATRELMKALHG